MLWKICQRISLAIIFFICSKIWRKWENSITQPSKHCDKWPFFRRNASFRPSGSLLLQHIINSLTTSQWARYLYNEPKRGKKCIWTVCLKGLTQLRPPGKEGTVTWALTISKLWFLKVHIFWPLQWILGRALTYFIHNCPLVGQKSA